MKKAFIPVLLLFSLVSCAPVSYFQVYKALPQNGVSEKNKITFEDKHCIVSYDLWGEGGNVRFNIYNNSDKDITVLMDKTFFVMNGVAYEYFQNRTFTQSANPGVEASNYFSSSANYNNPTNVSGTATPNSGVMYAEKDKRTIPSGTSININEYRITNALYESCDYVKYPSWKKIKTLKFDATNTPFLFDNRITYVIGNDTVRMENDFYVSEITNYPSSEMFTTITKGSCGESLTTPYQIFKDVSPNKFFIRY
jgi:hypothetical protein